MNDLWPFVRPLVKQLAVMVAGFFVLLFLFSAVPISQVVLRWGWLAISAAGMAFNVWATYDALRDLNTLQRAGVNGARHLVAAGNLRREVGRTMKQLLLLMVSFTAVITSPVTEYTDDASLFSRLISVAVIELALIITSQVILDRRDRERLLFSFRRTETKLPNEGG